MNPKDFKFNDDAFDDVMSSSKDDKNNIKKNILNRQRKPCIIMVRFF